MHLERPRSSPPAARRLGRAGLLLLLHAAAVSAATITVTTTADLGPSDNGFCDLREAVTAANTDSPSGVSPGECIAGSGDDVITFDLPLPAILPVNLGELDLTENVALVGPGASELTLEAQGLSRLLVLWQPSLVDTRTYAVSGVTLSDGWAIAPYQGFGANDGGGILSNASTLTLSDVVFANNLAQDVGGAIYWEGNFGTLTIERSTFHGNRSTSAVLAGGGGALGVDSGNLVVRDSLFDGNAADGDNPTFSFADDDGGAIWIWATSTLTVERSTFTNNTARGAGGAIAVGSFGATTYDVAGEIRHSTFTGNQADLDGDGDADGGAIRIFDNLSTTTLFNTLVAGNSDGAATPAPDIAGADLLSAGYNLVGIRRGSAAASFPAGLPNAAQDWVGTNGSPLDPGLLSLSDYGGPTETVALDAGSVAIDHGSCPAEVADQRGYANASTQMRAVDDVTVTDSDDGCDIGAYERLAVAAGTLWADGFETGDTSLWSAAAP